MKIKICGITNLEDGVMACDADALGFVFYEQSPRYITPQKAKEIITKLPPFIKSVGLFVNESPQRINEICKEAKIDIAQIHFEVSDDFLSELTVPYIKVIRATSRADILRHIGEYILVDAFVDSYGGEGKRVALEFFEGVDCSKIILAGGLNSENLIELKNYNFYGVDVSSGVESQKGKKDRVKTKEFIVNAKSL